MSLNPEKVSVTEGIEGTFRYHLSPLGSHTKGLCGKQTMLTQVPTTAWGVKSHLNEKWCSQCLEMASKEKKNEP